MTKNRAILKILLFSVHCLLFSVFWVGCASVKESVEPQDATHGQITIYLNGPEKTSMDITFELTNIKIIREDGLSKEIFDAPLKINAREVINRQLLLTERYIPEGRYKN